MSGRMDPVSVFNDWRLLLPRGDKRNRAELLQAWYDEQSRIMHHHNQQAAIAGQRAGWAFSQLRREKETTDGK